MKRYSYILVVTFASLLSLGTLVVDVGWAGGIIGLIGTFIVPSWLFIQILFGNTNQRGYESQFILVVAFGTVLAALETMGLALLKIKISRETIILTSTVISFVLLGVEFVVHHSTVSNSSIQGSGANISSLLIPIMLVIMMIALVSLHRPAVQESFTEFYASLRSTTQFTLKEPGRTQIVISSHEQKTHSYIMTCKESTGQEAPLMTLTLAPDSSRYFTLNSFQSDSSSKLRLNLYLDEMITPYRWIEVLGSNCKSLLATER